MVVHCFFAIFSGVTCIGCWCNSRHYPQKAFSYHCPPSALPGIIQNYFKKSWCVASHRFETHSTIPNHSISDSKKKGNCGRKRKTTPKDDCYIIKKSKQDPSKSSVELRNDLAGAGMTISASLVRRRLTGTKWKKSSKTFQKVIAHKCNEKKESSMGKKYHSWTEDEWKKVLFSDVSHFMVQGQQKQYERRSQAEKITEQHVNQSTKHPPKKTLRVLLVSEEWGNLIQGCHSKNTHSI